jgi:hypothetical protein
MNIAFDYDDTLDLAYELFSVITHSLIAAGHKVYIITHILPEYREYREKQLADNNIAYTELVISGDKYYECQKREIEYIFDDCRDYFTDIAPIYLQVFSIPSILKKQDSRYELEVTVKAGFSFSGIRTSYEYRYKKIKNKKWSDWDFVGKPKEKMLEDLSKYTDINELISCWKHK